MTDDEALRRAWRAGSAERGPAAGACPSGDELLAAAEGRLDDARRDAVAAHVAECEACAAIVAMAADVRLAADEFAQQAYPAPVALPVRRAPAIRPWHYALAAVLVLAFMPLLPWRAAPTGDPLRGDAGAVQPRDGASLATAPEALAWPRDAGDTCRATLRDAAGAVLLAGDASGGAQPLDAALRARLAPGDYVWSVDCGARRLGPFAFRITP
jgi:hypothetical protein